MFGTLYIIATPIGNLKDITLRALETLKTVDFIAAEDTRITKKLLEHFEISKPVLSYHHHSMDSKKLAILNLLVSGKNVGLVTDAGTPGINDPGNELTDFLLAYRPDIKVVPIPGVSAITCALSVCGFNTQEFNFLGFLPKRKLNKVFKKISENPNTVVYFDSPYRVIKNLENFLGFTDLDRRMFVGRELTKLHETLYRGNVKEVLDKLKSDKIKGEFIIVVEGKTKKV